MTNLDRAFATAIGAVYLAIAACAFLPGTQMFIREDARYLRGGWFVTHLDYVNSGGQYYSQAGFNPDTWTARTRTSQLAAALERNHQELTTSRPEAPILKSLEAYCDAHPSDIEAWAHLARLACQGSQPSSSASKIPASEWSRYMRFQTLQFKASEAGMKLEPDNAYFRLVHAGALLASGNPVRSLDDFLAASNSKFYRDYCFREADTIIAAIEENHGAIPTAQKLRIRAEVLLPHCAFAKSLVKLLLARNVDRVVEIRTASCKVAALMMGSHETPIVCMVGSGIFHLVLGKAEILGQYDSAESQQRYTMLKERSKRLTQAVNQWSGGSGRSDEAEQMKMFARRPVASAALLAATLASLPIAFCIAWGARRKLRDRESGVTSPLVFLTIQLAVQTAVAMVVVGAKPPANSLLFILILTALGSCLTALAFVPAGKISPWKLAGVMTLVCGIAFGLTTVYDARAEWLAQQVLSLENSRIQIALDAAM